MQLFCYVKLKCITYSDCVFVVLGIQDVMHMRHFFICGLPGSLIIFRHYLINDMMSGNRLLNIKYVYLFLYVFCLKTSLF